MRRMLLLLALLLTAACEIGGPAQPPLDPATEARLDRFVTVIQAVEPVAEQECVAMGIASNCNFQIEVDIDPEAPANAFQWLDRRQRPVVTFTLTLLQQAENSDELAFVLSHEVSHHILGHLQRQEQNARTGAMIMGRMATLDGASPGVVLKAREFGAALGARSFSKDFELEADQLGTVIAWESGFDPARGSAYFDRLPDPGDQFLGTHPPNAERKRLVRETLRELERSGAQAVTGIAGADG